MEISESAWAKARAISKMIDWNESYLSNTELIARLIMEERRECAEISEKFERSYCDARDAAESDAEFRQMNAGAYAAMDISQAIRNK